MNRKQVRNIIIYMKKDIMNFNNIIKAYGLNSEREDINKIISKILSDKVLYKKLEEIFLPHDVKILLRTKLAFNEQLNSNDLIEWTCFLIKIFSEKINKYLFYKEEYENLLFLENYERAFETLNKIEEKICVSVWSCQQRLLLAEMIYGLEENKKQLERFLKSGKNNLIVATLLEFYSFLSEENMSYLNYQDKIIKYIDSVGNDSIIGEYLDYKLNLNTKNNIDINIILQIESQFTIIDLYNSLIDVIQIKSFDGDSTQIKTIIKYISKLIKDYRINNLLVRYSERPIEDLGLEKYQEVYRILEEYTIGNYKEVINQATRYLNLHSNDFQITTILIKSLINLKQKNKCNLKIYEDLYNVYSYDKDYNISLNNLYWYYKMYNGTSWKYKIKGFLSRKQSVESTAFDIYLSYMNDNVLTPSYVCNILNKEKRKEFLQTLKRFLPETVKLFTYFNGVENEANNLKVDYIRKKIYYSNKEFNSKNYESSVIILKELENNIDKNDYYNLERIYRKLYEAYLKMDNFLEAVNMVIEAYFINYNLINRFNLKKLSLKVNSKNDDNVKRSINYPIFMYLLNKNDYKAQRIAYSNYLDKNNLKSIEEIIAENKDNKKALVFFLDKICVQHLLKRDIKLVSRALKPDDVRINILRNLMVIDSDNRKNYYDEINSIMMKKEVKDRIKQINQSKIFVDVENIKLEYGDILLENFRKYLKVKEFSDEIISVDITSTNYLQNLKTLIDDMQNRTKTDPKYNQAILELKNLISRITEEFLFNEKYGLNTFLSSRIRHGYCKSQITTIFDDYHLMSKSNNNNSDEYYYNEYWDSKYECNSANFKLFKKYLSDFTYKIEIKVNEIKNKWIRIRLYQKDEGLFDYYNFVEQSLILENQNIVDFEVFYRIIIDCLWKRTEQNLQLIRNKIEVDLKEYLLESLEKLELDMNTLKNTDIDLYIKEVKSDINLCKAKIDNMIKEFSGIFYINDVTYRDYTINDLVDTCIQICNKLNSKFDEINLIRELDLGYKMNGESFPYFVDVINILINNALEHSGIDEYSNLNLKISIKEEKNEEIIEILKQQLNMNGISTDCKKYMNLELYNNLNIKLDIEKVKFKVQKVFDNCKNYEVLKQYTQIEGGSGLYKLYKTIQYNIQAPYVIFYDITKKSFTMSILIGIDDLISKEGC